MNRLRRPSSSSLNGEGGGAPTGSGGGTPEEFCPQAGDGDLAPDHGSAAGSSAIPGCGIAAATTFMSSCEGASSAPCPGAEAAEQWPGAPGASAGVAGPWPGAPGAGARAAGPWPSAPGAVESAAGPWPGAPGAVEGAAGPWPGAPGAGARAAGPWPGAPGAGARAAGPWPGAPVAGPWPGAPWPAALGAGAAMQWPGGPGGARPWAGIPRVPGSGAGLWAGGLGVGGVPAGMWPGGPGVGGVGGWQELLAGAANWLQGDGMVAGASSSGGASLGGDSVAAAAEEKLHDGAGQEGRGRGGRGGRGRGGRRGGGRAGRPPIPPSPSAGVDIDDASVADWKDENNNKIVCELFAEECKSGNRSGAHLSKAGYKNVMEKFKEETGLSYTKRQFKNKWDRLKVDYGIWKKLTKQTGLGWDASQQNIDMPEEWWTKTCAAIKGANRFKEKGLQWEDKCRIMFEEFRNTGEDHWCPSTGVAPSPTSNSCDNSAINLDESQDDNVDESEPEEGTPTSAQGKRSTTTSNNTKGKKAKTSGGVWIQEQVGELMGISERISTSCESIAARGKEQAGCSIEEVMELVKQCGATYGTKEHFIACQIFTKTAERRMFLASTSTDEERFDYLTQKHEWMTRNDVPK